MSKNVRNLIAFYTFLYFFTFLYTFFTFLYFFFTFIYIYLYFQIFSRVCNLLSMFCIICSLVFKFFPLIKSVTSSAKIVIKTGGVISFRMSLMAKRSFLSVFYCGFTLFVPSYGVVFLFFPIGLGDTVVCSLSDYVIELVNYFVDVNFLVCSTTIDEIVYVIYF